MQTALLQWPSMAPGLGVVPGDLMATLTRLDLDAWVVRDRAASRSVDGESGELSDFGGLGPASREASVDGESGELSDFGGLGPASREASVDGESGELSGPKGERHGHRDD